ncbi:MAG: DUF1822 family protein, partial [Thermosynechococcaceae cyanobacterium]
AWCDRIAYVIVEIEDHFKQAQILGFSPQPIPPNGEIYLNQLQAVETLPQYLSDCKTTALSQLWSWAQEQGQAIAESVGGTLQGWQPTQSLNLAFMGLESATIPDSEHSGLDATRDHALVSKMIQLQDFDLALVMDLAPKADGSLRVELMVESELKNPLPAEMQLTIHDQQGQIFQTISAEGHLMARPFSAGSRERFSIELSYGEAKHREDFVI